MEYPSLNILIFYLSYRERYRPIIFSKREVFCSPRCETSIEGECFRTIKTPFGRYDIATIVNQLPPSQKPELVVVHATATVSSYPINLYTLDCPKLLLVGDTHHWSVPIRTILDYAEQEKFDCIMSEHDRQHLHYFKEAGFERVFWIPCFNINPYAQQPRLNPKYPISFIGQVKRFHPYRKYILTQLKQFGFPLNQPETSQEKAAEVYADSLINLNISLNGDLNLRVFEVLAAGGFLLSDQLSKQAGLELLFEAGNHLEVFKNESDLRYKLTFFLNNPETAKEIAHNGHEIFWRNHRPVINVQRVLDYVGGQNIDPVYLVESDKRSVYITSKNLEELRARLAIYEYFQELHRNQPSLCGLFGLKVDPRLICDLADLPRLEIHQIWDRQENNSQTSGLFARCGVADQIVFTSSSQLTKSSKSWDFIALTWAELQTMRIDTLLSRFNFQQLVITNASDKLGEEDQQAWNERLKQRGLVQDSGMQCVYHWRRKADWGNLLLLQERSLEAAKVFEQALQDNPWDATALIELGWLSYKLNDLKEAEQRLRRAVSLDRRNPLALECLAKVFIALEEFEEATSILEHLLLLKPEDSSLDSLLEICYHRMGREPKVLESYRNRHDRRGSTSLVEAPNKEIQPVAKTAAKRILVINNLYPPQELGGYGRRVCDFANVLRERGHTIQVLTSDAPYLGEVKSPEDDVERSLLLCGTYEELPPQYLEDSFKLSQILQQNDQVIRATIRNYAPDVCVVGNIDLLTQAVFEPLLQNKIPVVHLLGFAQTGYSVPDAPTSPLYHIAANSEFGRQSILSQDYPFEDIGIVYPGAFIDQFQMCTLPSLERLRIVFAGLVMPYKGPQTLLEALSILHDAEVDFECAIAGASPLEGFMDGLRAFVKAKGLENQVKFLGYLQRPQLIELFATHNVLVFPSVWEEPFGRSQVEAMAAGLTLITSGTGGSGEVIEPGVSGLTFPAGDATALAEAMKSLLKDCKRWESITIAGQKRAELFSIEHSVDTIEQKFDELLKRRDNEGEFEQQQLQADLQNRLQLREINIVIFPDWSQAEELLSLELAQVIKAIANHPEQSCMTLLVDTSNISDEDAELTISGVVMNLLMEEDLDVTEGPEISLIRKLSEIHWQALLPYLQARIILENENKQAIKQAKLEKLPSLTINSLSRKRAVQGKTGNWKLQGQ